MNDTMGKVFYLPQAGRVALCDRCGDPCKVAAQTNADARLLKHAEEPKGYCVNCAIAEWFYITGMREICPDPKSLLAKPVQEQFVRIMITGKADVKPPEINWQKVVANWDLPFKVGARKIVDPVAHPTPPPIRRARRPRKGG